MSGIAALRRLRPADQELGVPPGLYECLKLFKRGQLSRKAWSPGTARPGDSRVLYPSEDRRRCEEKSMS